MANLSILRFGYRARRHDVHASGPEPEGVGDGAEDLPGQLWGAALRDVGLDNQNDQLLIVRGVGHAGRSSDPDTLDPLGGLLKLPRRHDSPAALEHPGAPA